MKHPYTAQYDPAFPITPIILRNLENGEQIQITEALLDTGSDATLVPIAHLRQALIPALSEARIRSH